MTEQEVQNQQTLMRAYPPQELRDLLEGTRFAEEWRGFKREVVRLLAEGNTGRYVLVDGDQVIGVWTHSVKPSGLDTNDPGWTGFMPGRSSSRSVLSALAT